MTQYLLVGVLEVFCFVDLDIILQPSVMFNLTFMNSETFRMSSPCETVK